MIMYSELTFKYYVCVVKTGSSQRWLSFQITEQDKNNFDFI